MSENKKYYYLKLKDNFLESETMILLRNMQDGITYSYVLMFLYLKAVKGEGKLMFNDRIPYNSNMLASLMGVSVGVVEKAVTIFQQLGLVDVLDNGAIYMLDMQDFIGKSSSEADRKRKYRARIEAEKNLLESGKAGQCPTDVPLLSEKRPPEIEIEIEKDIKKEINKEKVTNVKKTKKFIPPSLEDVEAYASSRNSSVNPRAFWEYYDAGDWKDAKGNQVKNWKQKFLTWEKRNPIPSQSEPKAKKYQNADNFVYEDIFDNPPPYTYEEGLKQEENDLF